MKLTAETWGHVTAVAAERILEPGKSKEFLTPFDPNVPLTEKNFSLWSDQLDAIHRRTEAALIVCDFLKQLAIEAPLVIKEMERLQNEQGQ